MARHSLNPIIPNANILGTMSRQQIIDLRRDLLMVHHNVCKGISCKCGLKGKKLPKIPQ